MHSYRAGLSALLNFLVSFSQRLISEVAESIVTKFLLLARYVPNVAKRSIWNQCKKYIYTEDRPTINDWPLIWKNSDGYNLRKWSFDPLQDWFFGGVFDSRSADRMALFPVWSNWRTWKFQMAISPRQIIRFAPCLVLGWCFWGRPSVDKMTLFPVGPNSIRRPIYEYM